MRLTWLKFRREFASDWLSFQNESTSGRIAKEFGPVNREGGERRLNVLISRAKMNMEVFCNFRADELEIDSHASHGVRALKHFLKYAETRQLDIPIETGKEADSPFEIEVMSAIKERGFSVEPQVGTAGYFIDIAVKDPEFPGRYILAVECDGASYHSSKSARDRDRLRQGVLESLGWKFHRIWSTDWFRNQNNEINKVVAAIEKARSEATSTTNALSKTMTPKVTTTFGVQRAEEPEDVELPIADEYRKASLKKWTTNEAIHEVSSLRLASLISEVVSIEAPVHEAVITKRIMDAFGVSRAGNRIVEAIKAALRNGSANGHFQYEEPFAYSLSSDRIPVRSREFFDNSEKKIEHISPAELKVSLTSCVKSAFSITREAAISNTLHDIGFSRATSSISSYVDRVIDTLISEGAIQEVDGRLMQVS